MLEFWDFSGSPDYDLEESGQLQRDIAIESADSSPKAETQLRRIPELGLLKHGWARAPRASVAGHSSWPDSHSAFVSMLQHFLLHNLTDI